MNPEHARRDAFLSHLGHCESTLRAFIAGALAAADERPDFFQEVVLLLWRLYDRYDESRPFLPWAMGVAVRRMKEEYRRIQRRPGLLQPEHLEHLANALAAGVNGPAADEAEALAECLAGLPEHASRLVQRRYYDGSSIESLGSETGQSPAAVYQTLSRLRRRLADCIRLRLRRHQPQPASVHE